MSKNLASLKEIISGTGDKEPQTEAVAQLAQELYNTDLLIALIVNLQRIDFEVGFQKKFSVPQVRYVCLKKKKKKSIDHLLVWRATWQWQRVCLIRTSVPEAKTGPHIMLTQ